VLTAACASSSSRQSTAEALTAILAGVHTLALPDLDRRKLTTDLRGYPDFGHPHHAHDLRLRRGAPEEVRAYPPTDGQEGGHDDPRAPMPGHAPASALPPSPI
jgi:hypothetical protein